MGTKTVESEQKSDIADNHISPKKKGKAFRQGAIAGAFSAFAPIAVLQFDLYRGELLATGYLIIPLILGALGLLFGGVFGVIFGKLSSLIWKKEAASNIGSWIGGFIGGILLTLLSLILVGTALIGAQ